MGIEQFSTCARSGGRSSLKLTSDRALMIMSRSLTGRSSHGRALNGAARGTGYRGTPTSRMLAQVQDRDKTNE